MQIQTRDQYLLRFLKPRAILRNLIDHAIELQDVGRKTF